MNLTSLNSELRRRAPRLHLTFKGWLSRWMQSDTPWPPILRRVHRRWLWVHPSLLTAPVGTEEEFVTEWVMAHLPRHGILFDVGAHWGVVSLLAARRASRVVAFEPSPYLGRILRYHCRANRASNIEISDRVVTRKTTERIRFYLLNDGNSYRNSLTIGSDATPFVDPRERKLVELPAVSIDDYCDENALTPDLIKVDVEGAEQWVLEGARRTLERHRPVLIVSLHEYWMPPGHNETTVLAILTSGGYRIADERFASGSGVRVRDILALPS